METLPVPDWASAIPGNYRRSLNLPPEVSDEMIFARYQEARGMNEEDVLDWMKDLIEEVKAA